MTPSLSLIVLLVIGLLAALLINSWQKSHPEFDLADLLTGDNGKVSLSKFGQVSALIVSTWGFVVLVQQGKMTEYYFIGYMVAWTGAKLIQSGIDKKAAS